MNTDSLYLALVEKELYDCIRNEKRQGGICYVVETVIFRSLQTLAAIFPRKCCAKHKNVTKDSLVCSRKSLDALKSCLCIKTNCCYDRGECQFLALSQPMALSYFPCYFFTWSLDSYEPKVIISLRTLLRNVSTTLCNPLSILVVKETRITTRVVAKTRLLANSSYGYQIMDRSRNSNTKHMNDEKIHAAINNKMFEMGTYQRSTLLGRACQI